MRPCRGPVLEVDTPTDDERDWIFDTLQRPEIHRPLSLPRAPGRTEFDGSRLPLVDRHGPGVAYFEPLVFRRRADGSPWGLALHYGWESWHDTTRELDIAVPGEEPGPVSLYVEATVLEAQFVFRNGPNRRLRWRVPHVGGAPPGWYRRLGARSLGSFEEEHPATGEPIRKEVYEITRAEFESRLARVGVGLGEDLADAGVTAWQVLHG